MPESGDLWKQRYEFALEAAKRTEQEHRALVQQLSRAIQRVSAGCEGQDSALDQELEGLRAFLRLKTLSTDVLSSKIDVVEERLRALEKRRQRGDPRIDEALESLLDRLAATATTRELNRSLQLLRKEQRAGGDPLGLLLRALALHEPSAGAAQGTPPAAAPAAHGEAPGLLQRLFGRGTRDASGDAPASRDASPAPAPEASLEQAFEPLSDPASKALDALIDTVPAPAAEPVLRRVYEVAKARLARGVRWQELVPSIEEIRVLANAALGRGRDEFEGFLQQMNERLALGADTLAEQQRHASARADHAESLQGGLREDMQALREHAATAEDLEQLKREVSHRVENITLLMQDFREREQRLVEDAAAASAALAARVGELQQQAAAAEARIAEERRIALTDALTRLPNREAWTRRLSEEYERWRRYGRALSLAVCDIDRFKAVNDTHGHAGGDAVLGAVAGVLRETLRETDFVARFGGEEFVILMPETEPLAAAQALENVRRAIAALSVRTGDRSLQVTASFGVAGFGPGDEGDRVFQRADAALYRAKNSGRDRVAVYSDEDTRPA